MDADKVQLVWETRICVPMPAVMGRHGVYSRRDSTTHIPLGKELPHLQRITLDLSSLHPVVSFSQRPILANSRIGGIAGTGLSGEIDAHLHTTGQVHAREHEHRVLSRIGVDPPA
jgi:hypothetical protein